MKSYRSMFVALVAAFAFSSAAAADIKLPAYQTITLDNGATVLLMPRKDVPLVAANIAVRGGALADPAGKRGVAFVRHAAADVVGLEGRKRHAYTQAVEDWRF